MTKTDRIFLISMLVVGVGAGLGFLVDRFAPNKTGIFPVLTSRYMPADRVPTSHVVYPTGKSGKVMNSNYKIPPPYVVGIEIEKEVVEIDFAIEDKVQFEDGDLTVTYRRQKNGRLRIVKVDD